MAIWQQRVLRPKIKSSMTLLNGLAGLRDKVVNNTLLLRSHDSSWWVMFITRPFGKLESSATLRMLLAVDNRDRCDSVFQAHILTVLTVACLQFHWNQQQHVLFVKLPSRSDRTPWRSLLISGEILPITAHTTCLHHFNRQIKALDFKETRFQLGGCKKK